MSYFCSTKLEMNFKDADQGRNYLLIMQVGTVGLFFLLVFGVNALFHAEHMIGSVLLGIAAMTMTSMVMMRITRNHDYGANGI